MTRKNKNIFNVLERQAEMKADIRVIGCDNYYKLFPKNIEYRLRRNKAFKNLSAKKYLEKTNGG